MSTPSSLPGIERPRCSGRTSMSSDLDCPQSQAIRDEIADLERRLEDAKARLNGRLTQPGALSSVPTSLCNAGPLAPSSHHFLLLLSDSALPLGSFAFSSGLESYLAHTRPTTSFPAFLNWSLTSYASATLPFVLAAHSNPGDVVELDDCMDAAIMCTVGRRASVTQGRALLSIWDKSFRTTFSAGTRVGAIGTLKDFAVLVRSTSSVVSGDLSAASAHFGPIFGAIASVMGISLQETAYVFLLGHVKALVSAALRASMLSGPYQAQQVLASREVRDGIQQAIDREWNVKIEDAGQTVPVMDLWIGRHEMLYSRIFNS